MSESKKSAREQAAAARSDQLAAEKRRDRMIKIIGALVVLVVVGGIIAAAVITSKSKEQAKEDATKPDKSHASPTGTNPETYGYVVNASAPTTGIPQVQLWEDFQCPACKAFEDAGGVSTLEGLATAKTINLQLRPTTFLDANLNNTASAAATSAWGCAIDGGKALEYHKIVYANQPQKEGAGYTQEQLLSFGQQAGLNGDAYNKFADCTNKSTYLGWSANSNAQFAPSFPDPSKASTPAMFVNGKQVQITTTDPKALLASIEAAAK